VIGGVPPFRPVMACSPSNLSRRDRLANSSAAVGDLQPAVDIVDDGTKYN
jgi:hypothetical protein